MFNQIKEVILLWKPKLKATYEKGPSPISCKRPGSKEMAHYEPIIDEDTGRVTYNLPVDVARNALKLSSSKFFLLSPASLTVNVGSLTTGMSVKTFKAIGDESFEPVIDPKDEEDAPDEEAALLAKEEKKKIVEFINANGGKVTMNWGMEKLQAEVDKLNKALKTPTDTISAAGGQKIEEPTVD